MKINMGIEKECLVFDKELKPIDIDIEQLPEELTVDFANHQLEIVGKIHDDSHCTELYLNEILNHDYFYGKYIWPLSTSLDENQDVKHEFIDSHYRDYLANKYGIDKMLYSGIHFNYSNDKLSSEEDYFQLMKKIYEYMPILMQFTSFTPYSHHSEKDLIRIGRNFGLENSISLRASDKYGFTNDHPLNLDYSSLESFNNSKELAVKHGDLYDERELYTKVRLKNQGSHYVELRFLDLNPYYLAGISSEQMNFLVSALEVLTNMDDISIDRELVASNIERVALEGKSREIRMAINGCHSSLYEHTLKLFDLILSGDIPKHRIDHVKKLRWKYINNKLDIDIMIDEINTSNLSLMEFGKQNMFNKNEYSDVLPQYDMELSTKFLINEALNRGYNVDIESEFQNIVKITHNGRSEYFIQATKTNFDTYANVLLMNDKYMTKKILAEGGVRVPVGDKYRRGDQVPKYLNFDVVVKPLDTNFGLGISHVVKGEDLTEAVRNAFAYSNEIIIEEFINGEEFRFLMIDGKLASIVTRKNANVIGNNGKTIKELITEKNNSPMRSHGYKTPLEIIDIDEDLISNLKKQNLTLDSVLDCGEVAVLRDTSNVSQGGDSYEVSYLIEEKYKLEATRAVELLGTYICGIDMIIDLDCGKHAIIEANFNPAIHMHMYPYGGRGVDVASILLDSVFK